MPETKSAAKRRAKRVHISVSHVIKNPSGKGYFITPRAITTKKAGRVYAGLRAKGYSKERAAKISTSFQKKQKRKGR